MTDIGERHQLKTENGSWLSDSNLMPLVSFVIPIYNEVEHIKSCLDTILAQNYPQNRIEIHVIDGESNDGSVAVVEDHFIATESPVFLHNNPERRTPLSLNIGIKAAEGDIVVILGAHTEIESDFVRLNVANLRRNGVWCSGGTQINVGKTIQQASVGAAMSHWFGIPSAPYRYRKKAGFVNTVVYGAYRKEVFEKVGVFEEKGLMSEDSEFNFRLLQAGYKIYYDPRIRTRYYPRRTIYKLAKQMFNYGILRAQVLRKHRRGLKWLHFVPPLAVVLFLFLAIMSLVVRSSASLLTTLVLLYLVMAVVSAVDACIRQGKGNPALVLIAFIVMHVTWALGFWSGMLRSRTQF